MIEFIEHYVPGYVERTRANIIATDITIAIAVDFDTSGEKATKKLCKDHMKPYFQYPISKKHILGTNSIKEMAHLISRENIQSAIAVNIAGNGLYRLTKYRFTQEELDLGMYIFLHNLNRQISIYSINSGGQTGIDEAALKAAVKLKIPAICIAPYAWMFRDVKGKDICDEELFKSRFS